MRFRALSKYLNIIYLGVYFPMKGVHWLGSSRKDLRNLPASARKEAGTDIHWPQVGADPRDWKPMPQVGAGAREIRNRTPDGAFRIFYVVESAHDVYVLHVFQKKTERTSAQDIEKGRARYKLIP
jgi:phage-related protein